MRIVGEYKKLGNTDYFIPFALLPQEPPLALGIELASLYGETMLELGKLNEMANRLPDIKRFIKAYVTKEALLSSSIEGIHTTMLEVFTQPLFQSNINKETQLVMNYTQALYKALDMMHQGLPITSRLLCAAHEELMQSDSKPDPGNYRKQAVKVGNLVPPPPQQIQELMSALEAYINTDNSLPALIQAGLVHVQFETIHPFLDGNGRIGRLLIVLMLVNSKLIAAPILYPSYYFKKNHLEYYQRLDAVRTKGDFEGWITFYLKGIKESSIDAYKRAKDIERLGKDLSLEIKKHNKPGKSCDMKLQALSIFFSYPIISIKELSLQLDTSYNTANQIITHFIDLGFVGEENQLKRGKLFKFIPYFAVLEKEYA